MSNSSKKEASSNPYINNRNEWNERYGGYIQQTKMWKSIGLASLCVASIATVGALALAGKSKFVPYVVEVDKLGRVSNVTMPTTDFTPRTLHIKGALATWLQATRSVFMDGSAQRMGVERSFSCVNKADPSFIYLSKFSKTNWQRSADETVGVELIGEPLPITEKSWQIEWKETVKSRNGEPLREELWQGNFELYFGTPTTQKTMLKNPLGLYIKTISWTKQHTINL